jgi:hypothetical protein
MEYGLAAQSVQKVHKSHMVYEILVLFYCEFFYVTRIGVQYLLY